MEVIRDYHGNALYLDAQAYLDRLSSKIEAALQKDQALDLLAIDELPHADREAIEAAMSSRVKRVVFISPISELTQSKDLERLRSLIYQMPQDAQRICAVVAPNLLQTQLEQEQYNELLKHLDKAGFDINEVHFTHNLVQDLLRYFHTQGNFEIKIEDPRVQQKIEELSQQAVTGKMDLRNLQQQFEDYLWILEEQNEYY